MRRYCIGSALVLALQSCVAAQVPATAQPQSGSLNLVCALDGFSFTWPMGHGIAGEAERIAQRRARWQASSLRSY